MIVVLCSEGECYLELVEVPNIPIDLIVDTNGAGDSLVGGFFAAYS